MGISKAWLQVVGCFCILALNTWRMLTSYGAFQNYCVNSLLRTFSASHISWIGSVQAFLFLESCFLVEPLFSAGYLKPLPVVSLIFSTLGMFLTSLCTALWQVFLAQSVCMGIGSSCLFLPGPALISQHFQKHRSFAMGVSSSGIGISGIVFPLVFSRLQPRIGFGWTLRVIGFIMLATLLIPIVLMQYPKRSKKPQVASNIPESGREKPSRSLWIMQKVTDPSILRDLPYVWLQVGYIFDYMGLYIILDYISLFSDQHVAQSSSFFTDDALIILNAASILGRLVLSDVADVVGPVNTMIITNLITALMAFLLSLVGNTRGLIAWVAVFGFDSSAFTSLTAPGIVSVSDMKVAKIGARFGASFAIVGLSLLIAAPIAGAILTNPTRWTALLIFCGVLLFLGSVGLGIARVSKVGSKLKVRI